MQGQIRGLDQVAHMYYCGMSHNVRNELCISSPHDRSLFQCDTGFENVMEIKEINVGITYNAVHAKDMICIHLNFLVLEASTNMYTLFLLLD